MFGILKSNKHEASAYIISNLTGCSVYFKGRNLSGH